MAPDPGHDPGHDAGVSTVTYAVAHTSDLPTSALDEARSLLEVVFAGDLSDEDWDHALGGVHVIARRDGRVVGHGSVVQRRLMTAGRSLRTGYVEAVAVDPGCQRRGIGSGIMRELERIIHRAYDIGALGTSDEGLALYSGRGWVPWRGNLSVLTPSGIASTPSEAGAVLVLVRQPIDLDAPLVCDWRDGDVW